ncbi:unnamed protein product [Calypogeia fissa]
MDFASTSAAAGGNVGADQDGDDELDGFDDFTIASSWEKVIASVEATARSWQEAGSAGLLASGAVPVAGSRSLHRVHKEIAFGKKPYVVIFFFHVGSESEVREEWPIGLHHLQLWFGVRDFVVVVPVTHGGVILDAPEATTLLSTVAIALSSCGSDWPAFVPVHDPTRKGYKGVQGTNSSYSITFEADRIGSWVPVRFMHLEGLYELFVSKVAFTATSSAAVPALKVEFTMRLTYRTPMFGYDYQNGGGESPTAEAKPDYDGESPNEPAWDEDLPWGEWHSVDDPIKGFELIAIFQSRFVSSREEMEEFENASTFAADKWSLIPVFVEKKEDSQREEGFAGRLEALVNAFFVAGEAKYMDDFASVVKPEMDLLLETFTVPPPSVLDRVQKDLFYAAVIPSGEAFSFKSYGISVKGAPRDSLFGRFSLQALRFGTCNIRAISELWLEFVREVRFCWDECQPLPRVSPDEPPDLAACLLHQKLQLLAMCIKLKAEKEAAKQSASDRQDPHAMGSHFDKATTSEDKIHNKKFEDPTSAIPEAQNSGPAEVFEETLPSFPLQSSLDEMESLFSPPPQDTQPSTKEVPKASQKEVPTFVQSTPVADAWQSSDDEEPWEPLERIDSPEVKGTNKRRGSAGPFKNLMLLKVEEPMHAPLVQRSPVMTEDMLLEREQAIASLSGTPSERMARIRLQTDILASDMAAFKAANPGAVLEDFVQWHSPCDWLVDGQNEDGEISGSRNTESIERKWPPRGRLSSRMSQPDNVWRQIWEKIAPEPASEQKLLFDYEREGEKVIHYLDTLRPQQLLAQMLCTAFMASADALRRTKAGDMKRLLSEMEELYSAMSVVLEPLSKLDRADLPSKEEVDSWRSDLLQLCRFFEKVETDVFVAASLFQKVKMTPSLMTDLFTSFLDDGERLTNARVHSQSPWEGGANERELVAELFPVSNTSESMKRAQRMGNYLNGMEPDVREVKFQCYEEDVRKRWNTSSRKERKLRSKTFSHRMYVCGTSDDLQIALSVVSRD